MPVKDIGQILKELIPPADYQHRNGFSNGHIILALTDMERAEVEKILIEMPGTNDDDLIGETLAIMKSEKSLTAMRKRMESAGNPSSRIVWASFINEIKNGDEEMKSIVLREFDHVTEKYTLISVFHYLSRFKDQGIKERIGTYINHQDYLIAYNARLAIGIDTKELIERERANRRSGKWWQFWKS